MKLNSVSLTLSEQDCLDVVIMLNDSTRKCKLFSVVRPLSYYHDGLFQIKDNFSDKVYNFSNKDMPMYLEKLFKVSLEDFVGMVDRNKHESINGINMCQVMCFGEIIYG